MGQNSGPRTCGTLLCVCLPLWASRARLGASRGPRWTTLLAQVQTCFMGRSNSSCNTAATMPASLCSCQPETRLHSQTLHLCALSPCTAHVRSGAAHLCWALAAHLKPAGIPSQIGLPLPWIVCTLCCAVRLDLCSFHRLRPVRYGWTYGPRSIVCTLCGVVQVHLQAKGLKSLEFVYPLLCSAAGPGAYLAPPGGHPGRHQ